MRYLKFSGRSCGDLLTIQPLLGIGLSETASDNRYNLSFLITTIKHSATLP